MISNAALRHVFLGLLVTGVLGTALLLYAQPAGDRIISSADIKLEGDSLRLEVSLSFPFRYLSHFPQETGDEVRIRLQPVKVSSADLGAVFRREGMQPADAGIAAIDEVIYEGDAVAGPQLTVRFSRPVRYQLITANDYRRVTIIILETD